MHTPILGSNVMNIALRPNYIRIAGYDENACEQPWTVSVTLKLLVTVPPILIILLTFIFLHYYPITEKTRERTRRLLAQRRFVYKHQVKRLLAL